MEKNQKINCTVTSCKYNENQEKCSLEQIVITPIRNCNTKKTNESKCGSYEYESE